MTDKKQPEALRLADALERPGYGWHSTPAQCAAELRRQYAERETLRASHGQAPAQPVAEPAQVSAVESNTVGAVLSNKGLTPELAAALQRGADGVFDLLKDWHLINKDAKAGRRLWQIGRNLEGIFGCALRGDYTRASSAPAQPAPQQEAQEPVAWKHDCAALLTNDVELWIATCPHCGKPRTAPQHSPASQGDALDAARMNWLENDVGCRVFHLGKSWYTRANFGMPYRKRASLREAIDAARAAQEGK